MGTFAWKQDMSWKMQLNESAGTVEVQCSGNLALDDLTMLVIETSFVMEENGCSTVLLDLSDAVMGFSTDALAVLLDIYAEYSVPLSSRSGILLGAEDAAKDFSKFLTAAKEYGYRIDLLTESRQVSAWLAAAK